MNKKLLLVSDDLDPSGKSSFTKLLAWRDVDVVIAENVDQALGCFRETKFDLVVTDIGLEGSDKGLVVVKEIKKIDKQTKVFVATGFGEKYREESLAAGADGYITKPWDIEKDLLAPLGVKPMEEIKEVRPAAAIKSTAPSLRQIVHEIKNRNNLVIMVSSLLREASEIFLKEKKISPEAKKFIEDTLSDLENIEGAGKQADELLSKVSRTVYRQMDPDSTRVE